MSGIDAFPKGNCCGDFIKEEVHCAIFEGGSYLRDSKENDRMLGESVEI